MCGPSRASRVECSWSAVRTVRGARSRHHAGRVRTRVQSSRLHAHAASAAFQFRRRLEPVGRVLRQAPGDDRGEVGRHVRPHRAVRDRRLRQVRGEQLADRRSPRTAGGRSARRTRPRPRLYTSPRASTGSPAGLLRAHVRRRAEDHPGLRQPVVARRSRRGPAPARSRAASPRRAARRARRRGRCRASGRGGPARPRAPRPAPRTPAAAGTPPGPAASGPRSRHQPVERRPVEVLHDVVEAPSSARP